MSDCVISGMRDREKGVCKRESKMTNLLQHATHQRSVWCLSSVHEYASQSWDVCQWQSHQSWALDSERSSRSPPALPSPSCSCHRQHCSVNIAFCKSSSDYTTLSRTFNSFLELCLHQIILQIFSLSVCFGLGTCNTAQVSMLKARKFSSVARQISYLADMDSSAEIFCQSFLLLLFFFAGSHCEQYCPLFDMSIQHFLCRPWHHPHSQVPWGQFWEAVMAHNMPEQCKFPSPDSW